MAPYRGRWGGGQGGSWGLNGTSWSSSHTSALVDFLWALRYVAMIVRLTGPTSFVLNEDSKRWTARAGRKSDLSLLDLRHIPTLTLAEARKLLRNSGNCNTDAFARSPQHNFSSQQVNTQSATFRPFCVAVDVEVVEASHKAHTACERSRHIMNDPNDFVVLHDSPTQSLCRPHSHP